MSSKQVIMTTWCFSAFVGMVSRKVEEKIDDVIINDVYDSVNLFMIIGIYFLQYRKEELRYFTSVFSGCRGYLVPLKSGLAANICIKCNYYTILYK